jgi:phosphoglycerate kinase
MYKKTIRDIDIAGKKVLVRVDFNVPMNERQEIQDNSRIKAALPTINYLLGHKAKVILVSHLGRPKGKIEESLRMDPIARELEKLLGKTVIKLDEAVGDAVEKAERGLKEDEVILLENIRFYPQETENDPEFAKQLACCADIFVNDAFGTAHRAHASTVGVTAYLPSVAGFLLEKEVDTLANLILFPAKPFIVILGGNKVGDKLGVIKNFLDFCDGLIIGGGMCFTFLKAQGENIGASIFDEEQYEAAKQILIITEQEGIPLYLPLDIVAADRMAEDADTKVVAAGAIPDAWMGLDIGPQTIELYKDIISDAKTVFWNGPMGVFEMEPFAAGTKGIAEALAVCDGYTIVGGGDSDSALKKFNVEDKIDHVSTGGGASMKVLEGKPLPAVEALLRK